MLNLTRRLTVKLAPTIDNIDGMYPGASYMVIGTSTMVKEKDGKFIDYDMYVVWGERGRIVQVFPSKIIIVDVD